MLQSPASVLVPSVELSPTMSRSTTGRASASPTAGARSPMELADPVRVEDSRAAAEELLERPLRAPVRHRYAFVRDAFPAIDRELDAPALHAFLGDDDGV